MYIPHFRFKSVSRPCPLSGKARLKQGRREVAPLRREAPEYERRQHYPRKSADRQSRSSVAFRGAATRRESSRNARLREVPAPFSRGVLILEADLSRHSLPHVQHASQTIDARLNTLPGRFLLSGACGLPQPFTITTTTSTTASKRHSTGHDYNDHNTTTIPTYHSI